MRHSLRRLMVSLLVTTSAAVAAPNALAGTVTSSGGSSAPRSHLSKEAAKLVGTWRLVRVEIGGMKTQMRKLRYVAVLRADGTLSFSKAGKSVLFSKKQKMRWTAKGGYLLLTRNKKVVKLPYRLVANEIFVSMPKSFTKGGASAPRGYWVVFRRPAPTPRP